MAPKIQPPKTKSSDSKTLLAVIEGQGTCKEYLKKQALFTQGAPADAIFYIQKGRVKISVVSQEGKEAVVAILSVGDFVGEGCLAGQPLRIATATAATDCSTLRLDKAATIRALHDNPEFSAIFISHLLSRNIRIEEDLIDQLFNSSEKRLARVLLLMAHFGKEGVSEMSVPRLSQATLAAMVGTTRSRVSFFMNRFRKLGFIKYDVGDNLHVHSSLLNVVLHDDDTSRGHSGAAQPRIREPRKS